VGHRADAATPRPEETYTALSQPYHTSLRQITITITNRASVCSAAAAAAAVCCVQEEDFNVHIAGLPLEHCTTAAGAPATGIPPHNTPAHSSSSSNKKVSAAATAAATAAAAERVDKVFAALAQAIDAQEVASQQQGSSGSNVAAAIARRLQFRRHLLQGLIRLKRKQKQVGGAGRAG